MGTALSVEGNGTLFWERPVKSNSLTASGKSATLTPTSPFVLSLKPFEGAARLRREVEARAAAAAAACGAEAAAEAGAISAATANFGVCRSATYREERVKQTCSQTAHVFSAGPVLNDFSR
eukprot:6202130-Pleurochrysis_carterae.AAC.3